MMPFYRLTGRRYLLIGYRLLNIGQLDQRGQLSFLVFLISNEFNIALIFVLFDLPSSPQSSPRIDLYMILYGGVSSSFV